ncbi:MAG: SRPBCC family protein [Nitriliruptor sp.]|uniref:SRPBCC family protein n=1 Tax=Nitriliruptor sp. TaxID=2448056 RepID=UPI0034A04015
MRLEVAVDAAAPQQVVWDVLTTWERQSEWMLDARSVEVLTPEREGLGVTIRCPTNLLGVTVEDVMRVTAWSAPDLLEVTHLGAIITGAGAFELTAFGPDRTRIDWWEEVDPPLGRLGEWGASAFVLPILRRIFTRSLTNLARLAEAEVEAEDAR